MKCQKCGFEFEEGIFCPECGTKNEEIIKAEVLKEQEAKTDKVNVEPEANKKRIPWYLSFPFIILIALITMALYSIPGIVLVAIRWKKYGADKKLKVTLVVLIVWALFYAMLMSGDSETENGNEITKEVTKENEQAGADKKIGVVISDKYKIYDKQANTDSIAYTIFESGCEYVEFMEHEVTVFNEEEAKEGASLGLGSVVDTIKLKCSHTAESGWISVEYAIKGNWTNYHSDKYFQMWAYDVEDTKFDFSKLEGVKRTLTDEWKGNVAELFDISVYSIQTFSATLTFHDTDKIKVEMPEMRLFANPIIYSDSAVVKVDALINGEVYSADCKLDGNNTEYFYFGDEEKWYFDLGLIVKNNTELTTWIRTNIDDEQELIFEQEEEKVELPKTYIVKFYVDLEKLGAYDTKDEILIGQVEVLEGEAAIPPEDYSLSYHKIVGWSEDLSCITSDMEVYAVCKALEVDCYPEYIGSYRLNTKDENNNEYISCLDIKKITDAGIYFSISFVDVVYGEIVLENEIAPWNYLGDNSSWTYDRDGDGNADYYLNISLMEEGKDITIGVEDRLKNTTLHSVGNNVNFLYEKVE